MDPVAGKVYPEEEQTEHWKSIHSENQVHFGARELLAMDEAEVEEDLGKLAVAIRKDLIIWRDRSVENANLRPGEHEFVLHHLRCHVSW